ncbi:MAG: NAD(+) diphosphatase [Alteromonadaceae bacterium]|nr:MAG: NAD(+) diphosphatase [Alteromonadaceae bacterium]
MVFEITDICHVRNDATDTYVVIQGGKLLCLSPADWEPFAYRDVADLAELKDDYFQHLGQLGEVHCYSLSLPAELEVKLPEGGVWLGLRDLLGCVSEVCFQLLGRALQVDNWWRTHQFCGTCGAKTEALKEERARYCNACDLFYYPRISPCVIGLIRRGSQCLLARGSSLPEGMFSTLAGFVEAGEMLEQALCREVKEEVSIEITNLRYVGSQPWPFPGQLMLGFIADYAGGEICVDGEEIIEAAWFDVDNLPNIPPASTIAGRLIQRHIDDIAAELET